MALPPPGNDALAEMGRVVSTTIDLVSQLKTVVSNLSSDSKSAATTTSSASDTASLDPTIDALALARDSATLIRAHATKISLFIINTPFTPTAITKVLRELVAGPLPALASAAQLCDPKRYTQAVSRDMVWRAGRVLREVKELVKRIPTDGKVLSDAKKNSSFGTGTEKGSVATTGVLWSACDDVISLASLGVAGYLMRKVEEFRDTLKDIMEELKEWSEEQSDEEDDEDDEDSDNGQEDIDEEVHHSADEDELRPATSEPSQSNGALSTTPAPTTQEMLDDIMNSHTHIPRDDPERLRPKLDSCLRRLRLTVLLYQAALKRRFKTLPPLPPPSTADTTIPRLDEIVSLLKLLPEQFGSIALAFYDLDGGQIDSLMDECFLRAFAASELLMKPWGGKKDEFTDWALKYQIEIKKA